MDVFKSLIENTLNVFFAALATAFAKRLVSGKRKKRQRKTTRVDQNVKVVLLSNNSTRT